MPKTTRKFPTDKKTTTPEGKKEYMKLQMREYRERKAILDKATEEIKERINKQGQEWTGADLDSVVIKSEAKNAEAEKILKNGDIDNTYVFKIIDVICNGLDELNRIHGKTGLDLQMWKDNADQIKRRIKASQVSAFNFGFSLGEQSCNEKKEEKQKNA